MKSTSSGPQTNINMPEYFFSTRKETDKHIKIKIIDIKTKKKNGDYLQDAKFLIEELNTKKQFLIKKPHNFKFYDIDINSEFYIYMSKNENNTSAKIFVSPKTKINKNKTKISNNTTQDLNNYFQKEQTKESTKTEIIGEIKNGIIKICREEQIKKCMFCGKIESLEFILKSKLFNKITEEETAILCNKEKQGCGALGPFSKKKEQTIELWNTRII